MNKTTNPLRVAVADDDPDTRQFFQEVLSHLGHEVVAVAETGRDLVARSHATRPDLVITDVRMPDMDGIEAAVAVNRDRQVPVILVTGHHEQDFLTRAGNGPVMAYLSKPIKPVDLQAAISLAVVRFEQFQQLSREAASLRQALEDRKVIERAKGVAMRRLGLDEQEAFRRLQKAASEGNRKLVEVAHTVLKADEIFAALDRF